MHHMFLVHFRLTRNKSIFITIMLTILLLLIIIIIAMIIIVVIINGMKKRGED